MKYFFYSIYSDTILNNKKPPIAIGGADVQLAMWAKAIAKTNKVYTFSYFPKRIIYTTQWGIHFCFTPLIRKVMIILNWFKPLTLFLTRPDVVVLRGIPSELRLVECFRKLLNFKLLYMVASDMDVNPDAFNWNKRIPIVISHADFVIAQNSYQFENAVKKLGVKNIVQISNVWNKDLFPTYEMKKIYDYIWVGNFREIKRPEWLIEIAKANPEKKFAVVGADLGGYTDFCKQLNSISNVEYVGSKTLFETTKMVSMSKCLLCTSVKEGFPNTFLQAFSYNIPIISTVDPSDIIKSNKLGYVVNSVQDINNLIKLNSVVSISAEDIKTYFDKSHSIESAINIVEKYIY